MAAKDNPRRPARPPKLPASPTESQEPPENAPFGGAMLVSETCRPCISRSLGGSRRLQADVLKYSQCPRARTMTFPVAVRAPVLQSLQEQPDSVGGLGSFLPPLLSAAPRREPRIRGPEQLTTHLPSIQSVIQSLRVRYHDLDHVSGSSDTGGEISSCDSASFNPNRGA